MSGQAPARVVLDGASLTRAQVAAAARDRAEVALAPGARERLEASVQVVLDHVRDGEIDYGVTTGFGSNADRILRDADQAAELQRNLIITHSAGVGPPLPDEIVRAVMLIRINTLLKGNSGVRPGTVDTLLAMLNAGILPVIPEKGSVGASGDLAPLAHMALGLIGEGDVIQDGVRRPAAEALAEAGIAPVVLTYKEGLGLINGTALMLAFLSLGLFDLERLLKLGDVAAAMAVEAIAGRKSAFRPEVHGVRPHPGQAASARNILALLEGSSLADIPYGHVPRSDGSWRWNAERDRAEGGKAVKPQDSYSLRCSPQVHGAARDSVAHACAVVDIELNSVTDNPVVFPDTKEIISAGNFHGMPLALAASLLKAVIPTLASIAERRLNKLVDPATNDGLPAFLIRNEDATESGVMIVQYTAASVVNDLASRAFPASVVSIPTCANTEDHVSMGANEARHVRSMLEDLERVVALELYVAAQAVDVRERLLDGTYFDGDDRWLGALAGPERARLEAHARTVHAAAHRAGPAIDAVRGRIRQDIEFLDRDRVLTGDLTRIVELARGTELIEAAEGALGRALE